VGGLLRFECPHKICQAVRVSRTLGHSKISVTLDIYRHVLESEMKEHVIDLFTAPLPVRAVPVIAVN
jgi:hypothetical protein